MKQTWGVWWTTIFFLLQTLVYVVAFFIITTISGVAFIEEVFPLAGALAGVSFVLLLIAVVLVVTVKGLLEHKMWAWLLSLLFWAYYVISYLITLKAGSIIGLAIAVIALYGLLNKQTTKLFKIS